MASFTFGILQNDHVIGSGIAGSGLGFYGSNGFGTVVDLLSYQGSTFVTNSDGTLQGPAAINNKYLNHSGVHSQMGGTGLLAKLNSSEATLIIHFDHSAQVKTQNTQIRIYDRNNIDNPASGAITKVAEIVNYGGINYSTWANTAGNEFVTTVGSGDAFWWGSPWPNEAVYDSGVRPYYQNSVGVKFYNFTSGQDAANSGNPDSRLAGLTYPGKQTVGGAGLIVPLMDSPGSGGRFLAPPFNTGVPKFIQYVSSSAQTSLFGMTARPSGTYGPSSYGGTGVDTRHTWRVALSAAPLSIGSKLFSMYISTEYL